MFIPKGSIIFIAVWALHHMESEFKGHNDFNPDRYLNHPKLANDYAGSADYESRDHFGYGAGRRICPGIHLAERNMWRIAAKLLWAFDFAEPVDSVTGKMAPLDSDAYHNGILMMPLPFKVRITPRSETHVKLIKSELAHASEFLRQFE
jgi:cytochrome P450